MAALSPSAGRDNVRRFYAGDALGSALDHFYMVALPLYALTTLGLSATWLGVLMGAQYLPALLVAQAAARRVDAMDRRQAMSIASFAAALMVLVLALVPRIDGAWAVAAVLLISAAGIGLTTLVYQIASTAAAPTIETDRSVTDLLAGQGAVRTVSRLVGMGLAGPLIELVGGRATLVLAAMLLLTRAFVIRPLRLRPDAVLGRPVAPAGGTPSGLGSFATPSGLGALSSDPMASSAAGPWTLAWRTRPLRLGLTAMFVLNVGGAIASGAYFAYAHDLLQLRPSIIGAAMTLGTVAAVLALRGIKRALALKRDAAWLCGLSGMVAGLATWVIPATPAALGLHALVVFHILFGAASTVVVVTFTVLRQRLVDNAVLAQVASLSVTLGSAAIVAGGVLASMALPLLGAVGTIALGAAVATCSVYAWLALARTGDGSMASR